MQTKRERAFLAHKAPLDSAPSAEVFRGRVRVKIEQWLGTRLKHDYGENPYIEVRVWEIAGIAALLVTDERIAARQAQAEQDAQITEALRDICESAGPMGSKRDPSMEFSIVATALIEAGRAAIRAAASPLKE